MRNGIYSARHDTREQRTQKKREREEGDEEVRVPLLLFVRRKPTANEDTTNKFVISSLFIYLFLFVFFIDLFLS
jgi:hypothetical protein